MSTIQDLFRKKDVVPEKVATPKKRIGTVRCAFYALVYSQLQGTTYHKNRELLALFPDVTEGRNSAATSAYCGRLGKLAAQWVEVLDKHNLQITTKE